MTAPRKYQYRIQYIDNTYQIVDWTKGEFKKVQDQLNDEKPYIVMANETFRSFDIRAIVLLPDPPEEPEKQEDENNSLTEWGFVDAQTREWLQAAGIDLSKGVKK